MPSPLSVVHDTSLYVNGEYSTATKVLTQVFEVKVSSGCTAIFHQTDCTPEGVYFTELDITCVAHKGTIRCSSFGIDNTDRDFFLEGGKTDLFTAHGIFSNSQAGAYGSNAALCTPGADLPSTCVSTANEIDGHNFI